MREITEETQEIATRSESKIDPMHDRLDNIVEMLIDLHLEWGQIQRAISQLVPVQEQEAAERQLASRLGPIWNNLTPETQDCIVTATMLMTWRQNVRAGWQYPVLGLWEAVERELDRTLEPLRRKYRLSAAQVAKDKRFRWEDWLSRFAETNPSHPLVPALLDLVADIRTARELRNAAAHAARARVSVAQAKAMDDIVLGPRGNGLLAKLVAIRTVKGSDQLRK